MGEVVGDDLTVLPAERNLPSVRGGIAGVGRLAQSGTTWLFAGGLLLVAWLMLWNKLRADWSVNEQYEYGWFVPPLAFVLLALRWADRPAPGPVGTRSAWAMAILCLGGLFLLLPVRLIEEPNPDWRMLFWAHASVLILLSLVFFAWAGGRPWSRHFAFPIGFLLLAVPWPSEPEQWIVQSLMRGVAAISAEGMNVLGIPAVPQGNLIHIRQQVVGVSEACSGIRSLQATLMAGLLFGELSRLSWQRRVILVVAGLALALAANVFRSSLLVWVAARHGAEALEKVHDFAGFSVLIIVFVGLMTMNRLLSPRAPVTALNSPRGKDDLARPTPTRRAPAGILFAVALWLAAVEAGTAAWYGFYAPPMEAVPRWTVDPPESAPGFERLKIDAQTTQILRYDQAVSARWTRPDTAGLGCTLFFFRWEPGHASTTQAEMHQPHICLTASGMTQVADFGVTPVSLSNGLQLPVRRYEFTLHGRTIHVFFVSWQDRAGAQTLANGAGSRWDRLRAVAEHRANLGRQTLEFIASGPQTAEEANDWFEREIHQLVRPLGVAKRRPS